LSSVAADLDLHFAVGIGERPAAVAADGMVVNVVVVSAVDVLDFG